MSGECLKEVCLIGRALKIIYYTYWTQSFDPREYWSYSAMLLVSDTPIHKMIGLRNV